MEQLEKDALAICEAIKKGHEITRAESWIVAMYLHYSSNPLPYPVGHTYGSFYAG